MAKLDGASFKDANYITAIFPQKASDNLKTRTELFRYAQETPTLKDYIKTHVSTINDLFLTVGSIRNTGQHAGAVIQTPEKDENGKPMEIYDWFPVKKVDGHLVSEWTGAELDKLGFIKNDFLGLNQLDKVKSIIDLVKANKNIVVELGRVPLKDEKTYFYFQEGFVQDIFQFSGDGMAAMIMELMPDNIEHLIAANALYRPGAMSSGFDKEYIKLRHGQKIPEFITGTEKALKDTMGLMIYQESTMSLVVEYAGFTMSMADDLRKAIGKKLPELMAEQKDKFIDGAKRLGRDQNDAIKIWEQIERTAEYQFNRSHSVTYAILGYTTMYLKAHYPVEFYTIALQFANDVSKPKIISEMNRLGEVKVMQPSINESGSTFKPDFKTNKIYWSLVSVKWVGERAVEKIVREREENGPYFSVKDLFDRVDKRTVNKRTIHNLILAGAFDEVYNLKRESDRLGILREYYEDVLMEELPEAYKDYSEVSKPHVWVLWAKELTGLGYIDYKSLVPSDMDKSQLINLLRFQQSESLGTDVLVSGVVSNMIERTSKNGKFLTMEVEHNSDLIKLVIWNETYEKYKKDLKKSNGRILFMTGIVKFDDYKSQNSVRSDKNSKIEIL